jgi:outer membrane protein assembly factor BamB
MPNELPPNVAPTADVLLAQALDEQKFGKPLDAMSSEFFSTGANLVELRVKLLEPKVTYVQSIKPRGPTHITGNLTAGSSTADVAEEVFNDIKRDKTGGVKGVDESRYEVTLRRWLGGVTPVEWKGEVMGAPMFFSLKTVDLLVAGQRLMVFDKQNKEMFEAKLAYSINARYHPDRWDHHSVPAVEGPGGLYFFDEGVLTAFSLSAGEVRWRLTSVGISRVQFDEHGVLYVDSTSSSPEDIQYSDQIKLDKAAPVLLKIDPSSGKILWQDADLGQRVFLSGPFLYSASANKGGAAIANGLAEALNAPQSGAPVYFHIYRLDPAEGKKLWDFYREEAPDELHFQQTRFLLRFGSDVQVWKFLTF